MKDNETKIQLIRRIDITDQTTIMAGYLKNKVYNIKNNNL